jgi:hypothetical protein
MSTAPDPSTQPTALDQLASFTARQRVLLGVLVATDKNLGMMFVGAVMARATTDNPEYLQQASHSLRELINELPHHFADASVKSPDKLSDKVKVLAAKWRREPRVKNNSDEGLSDQFVGELEEFFDWEAGSFPARREVARRTVTRFDPSGRLLPQRIEERHADEWMDIRDFFVRSAHHSPCSADDFDRWYNAFESFMLARIKPRTFERADEIDALIREGES